MTQLPIYLDNNATTHIDPVVAQRMHELNLAGISNPASQHRPGRQSLHIIEEAKSLILESIGAPNYGMDSAQVILTSGGTEANNLAIFGLLAKRPGIAIVGGTDHPSVTEAAKHASVVAKSPVQTLPIAANGLCDPQQLEDWLTKIYASNSEQVAFVSLMLGNNETGVLQDLKTICNICRRYDVPVHSDIVQAVGKSEVNMTELGLSAATLTAHKIHGPVGVGALVLNRNIDIAPTIIGGGQQLGLRAGTEPVVPAVGLSVALKQIIAALHNGEYERVRRLRDHFESLIKKVADVIVIGADSPRLPHTSNISFVGLDRQALYMALDMNGLACSTGSACSSGSSRPSGILLAMGLPEEVVRSSLRFSFSRFSTPSEVESAARIISKAVEKCSLAT